MEIFCKDLGFAVGANNILNSVSLELKPGSTLGVWGNSGSGKSVLLKLIPGLLAPTSGTICWNKTDIQHLGFEERRSQMAQFGMVFQNDALFDSLDALHNVSFPLERRGVSPVEAQRQAADALAQVQLSETVFTKFPRQLSGGMKKRVGIARAIVGKPSVLICDDPFAGLDIDSEREMAKLIEAVQAKILIFASAIQPQSMRFQNHIELS
jgi:phospholipid/cholesterol/gamma-HCH transport system ATP-binding protein